MFANEWMTILAVATVLCAGWAYYFFRTGVPTFPSMPVAREKIITQLRADMKAQPADRPYVIYDLGSGSGQLSWHVARAIPEAKVIGIELSFVPWLRSVIWQKLSGQQNLRYLRVSFWDHDVSDASAVLTYLMEAIMPRISAKLRRELRPETLVISNKFVLPGWPLIEELPLQSAFTKRLWIYRHRFASAPTVAPLPDLDDSELAEPADGDTATRAA